MSEQLSAIKTRFFELEQQLSQVCSAMRFELARAEEENQRLRAEVETSRRKLEVFTEEEAAECLRMSPETLARLRKKKNLPHLREGILVRYTAEQLVRITQILERPQLAEIKRMRA